MEELLQSLLQAVESPAPPPTPQSSRDMTMVGGVNRENGERYVQQASEDLSTTQSKPWLQTPSLGGKGFFPLRIQMKYCLLLYR